MIFIALRDPKNSLRIERGAEIATRVVLIDEQQAQKKAPAP
ncbi:hypothetical protein [Pseudomonas ovata]|nr:hypothetical protein [Pseudomonas ovata]